MLLFALVLIFALYNTEAFFFSEMLHVKRQLLENNCFLGMSFLSF